MYYKPFLLKTVDLLLVTFLTFFITSCDPPQKPTGRDGKYIIEKIFVDEGIGNLISTYDLKKSYLMLNTDSTFEFKNNLLTHTKGKWHLVWWPISEWIIKLDFYNVPNAQGAFFFIEHDLIETSLPSTLFYDENAVIRFRYRKVPGPQPHTGASPG